MRAPAEHDFASRLRSPAVAARVGVWLGICFGLVFLTGLISHYAQNTDHPIPFPTVPAWGYRVTQGLHVVVGYACVPLLLVKLWAVIPKLLARPPTGPSVGPRELVLHLLERASIGVLVAASIFQLATGIANAAQWYPWLTFSYRPSHYAGAWIAIGALLVHIAVKLPIIRTALGESLEHEGQDRSSATEHGALSRRGLLRTTWLATAVAVLVTAGSTVPLLRKVSVLGVRSGDGPVGIPINKSARAAGVTAAATASTFALTIAHNGREVSLTRDDLLAMSQHTYTLPITCVEGWSASGDWTGPRVRNLLDLVEAPRGRDVRVESLQESGPFRITLLQDNFADADNTLLALALAGEPLALDHGFPCRLIAPNRPGVLQTKWVTRLDVL